ncbi:hypothetical protein M3Y98_00892800 [Aphelenchoides besseyi]|nr:hypothetical protein M3Y98_00892800 [Aphelenchoides besseyi]KAI6193011.1 hypothetical protein M3Y96_00972900 [Aphelenchoides besseyi]
MSTAVPLPHRVGPKADVPEVPFHALFLQLINAQIQQNPERIAFIHDDNPNLPTVTFKQLLESSLSFAHFIQSESLVQRGDIAAISLPSSWHYVLSIIGMPANGAVLSGFSYRATIGEFVLSTLFKFAFTDEALHQLRDSGAVVLMTTVENYQRLSAIFDKLPNLRSIILLKTREYSKIRSLNSNHRLFDFDCILKNTTPKFDFNSVKINPKTDLLVLPYSSGTTGLAKGVMITHYNYVAMLVGLSTHAEREYTPVLEKYAPNIRRTHDYTVLILPLYHAMGFFSLVANVARGNTVVLIQNYTEEKLFSAVQKYRPRVLTMIPGLYNRFLHSAKIKNYDLSSILSFGSGGSTLSSELSTQFQNRFKSVKMVTQGYGMTELTTAAFSTSQRATPGSIGIALPNVEYRIVKDNGEEAGTNEEGELWVRAPTVMLGYWKNEKATSETIVKDGWLRTGDLVREDENRQVFVVGRVKELIKVNSFQVPPTELEGLIDKMPDVKDCAVIGIPDPSAGELPRAYVVPRPNSKLTPKQVIDHVASRVSAYKQLRGGVEFVTEIPRSEAGKIARRRLLMDYLKKQETKSRL